MSDAPTKLLLGLIGSGIQASRTPAMQEQEAAEHGIRCIYQLIDLDKLKLNTGWIPELLVAAERMGFSGLNVTHPCKQEIVRHLTDLSEHARTLGAVDTILLRDGKRIGHNTDWWGFAESFRHGLPEVPLNRVVQLGAGGAGSATAYAALRLGVKHLTIFDLDVERTEALVENLGLRFGEERVEAGEDLAGAMARADGLIHATHTGMVKYPGLPLPEPLLHPRLWVSDIVYFPLETELLRAARRAGCRTLDGSGMAIYQAAKAFELFTGIVPDAGRMARHFASLGGSTGGALTGASLGPAV